MNINIKKKEKENFEGKGHTLVQGTTISNMCVLIVV